MTLEELINSGDPREIKRALSVKMFLLVITLFGEVDTSPPKTWI